MDHQLQSRTLQPSISSSSDSANCFSQIYLQTDILGYFYRHAGTQTYKHVDAHADLQTHIRQTNTDRWTHRPADREV